ncbi:hypothetical protein VTL71DRAFT_3644 [Oculimacula yallundae]|uniref:Uncharacterized protein n=1 Tax=Oculimacula yallundae TaxID=86028 RepID=A0ABR4C3I7_9HELO
MANNKQLDVCVTLPPPVPAGIYAAAYRKICVRCIRQSRSLEECVWAAGSKKCAYYSDDKHNAKCEQVLWFAAEEYDKYVFALIVEDTPTVATASAALSNCLKALRGALVSGQAISIFPVPLLSTILLLQNNLRQAGLQLELNRYLDKCQIAVDSPEEEEAALAVAAAKKRSAKKRAVEEEKDKEDKEDQAFKPPPKKVRGPSGRFEKGSS